MNLINNHKDIDVYKLVYHPSTNIFELSKSFPPEEKHSLTDLVRRPSRSVVANIAGAFRKHSFEKAFISKFSDAEGEAVVMQTWPDFSKDCHTAAPEFCDALCNQYEHVTGMLVNMMKSPEKLSIH